jgi:pimeloyl-ACP methyl ester carboxylesterase
MGMDLGAEVFVRQSIALRDRMDSSTTLATITCPVSIICGDEDELCAVSVHEAMALAIPNAELEVVAQCGHLSTLEQPLAVNSALTHWLQPA